MNTVVVDAISNLLTTVILLLIFGLFIKWLLVKLFAPIKRKEVTVEKQQEYRKKITVMNDSEMALFQALVVGLPKQYHIFPKMRIADMLDIVDGRGYYHRRNQILPKHVDFLICSERMEPLLAIELDGGSHNKPSRIERDYLVDGVFKDGGLELLRLRVGTDFKAMVMDISQTLKG